MKPRALSLAIALCALVTAASTARATVMVEVPLEDLVRDSDAIVVGRVERVGTRLVIDGGARPHTIVTLRVDDWIKGSGGELVTIDEIGGVTQELGMRIDGTPEYRRGEEVVVFLRSVGRSGYRTYAMAQGHFEILRGVPGADDLVVRDTSSIGFATWESGPMTIDHGGRTAMRLADFLGYVGATLEQLRVPATSGGRTQ